MADSQLICIDLETLDTLPTAAIVTLAGVRFNMENDDTEDFMMNVSPTSCKEVGMTISKDTIDWWRKQKPEAVSAWKKNPNTIQHVLQSFTDFVGERETYFFCLGASFDYPILEYAYHSCGKKSPLRYYNLIDQRTIYWMAQFNTKDGKRIGTYHNALDDCKTQIYWMKQLMLGKDPRG